MGREERRVQGLDYSKAYFVKNWRPITLLNSDYKIAAKAIANRLQNVLPKPKNRDQTGFLKEDLLVKT